MAAPTGLPAILARWAAEPARYEALRQRMIDCRPQAHPRDILNLVADRGAMASRPRRSPPPEARRAPPYVQLEDEYQDGLRKSGVRKAECGCKV